MWNYNGEKYVVLVYNSVVIQPFLRLAFRSKNATFFCDDSYVNLKLGFFMRPYKCIYILIHRDD